MRSIMMMGAVAGKSDAATDSTESGLLTTSTMSAKRARWAAQPAACTSAVPAPSRRCRQAREQRCVKQVAEQEVDGEENAFRPGKVKGELGRRICAVNGAGNGRGRHKPDGDLRQTHGAYADQLAGQHVGGFTVASITSKIREVFSWMIDRATFMP